MLAFILVYDICRRFHLGQQPWQPTQFQERWQIPIRLIRTVLQDLKEGQVVVETAGNGFVPARDLSTLTMKDVEVAVMGLRDPRVQAIAERMKIPLSKLLSDYQEEILRALASRNFLEILEGRGGAFGAAAITPKPAKE